MVPIFQNLDPRPGENTFSQTLTIKSGYSRETNVASELHTKIAAEVEASMKKFVASVSGRVSSEVSAALSGSIAISNTAEREQTQRINLDLTQPVYVYQIQYSSILADGSALDCWGSGLVVSANPI
mmetsp:Transcript_7042/g.9044  ORF Transcript_7042/g.9044 Transcript_7042/m.9044 type:complete len:126 (-) Transcript_7042:230-607(-)